MNKKIKYTMFFLINIKCYLGVVIFKYINTIDIVEKTEKRKKKKTEYVPLPFKKLIFFILTSFNLWWLKFWYLKATYDLLWYNCTIKVSNTISLKPDLVDSLRKACRSYKNTQIG